MERFNRKVKRCADVVGIFTNKVSVVRLIGAVLMDANAIERSAPANSAWRRSAIFPPSGGDETDLLASPDDAPHPTPAAA